MITSQKALTYDMEEFGYSELMEKKKLNYFGNHLAFKSEVVCLPLSITR